MSQTLLANDLAASLRALRVGLDDDAHVRRTLHLAAAKIEDLQEQVTRLAAALEATGQFGGKQPGGGQPDGVPRRNGSRDGRH